MLNDKLKKMSINPWNDNDIINNLSIVPKDVTRFITTPYWNRCPDIPYPYISGAVVVYNDKIHLLGGRDYKTNHFTYDGSVWTYIGSLPYEFDGGRATVYDNKIHILGGYIGNYGGMGGTKHYAFDGSTWTQISTLPYEFVKGAVVTYKNQIHLLGGEIDGKLTKYHYVFNGLTWSSVDTLPSECGGYGIAAVADEKYIYMIGENHGTVQSFYRFNGSEWQHFSEAIVGNSGYDNLLLLGSGLYHIKFGEITHIKVTLNTVTTKEIECSQNNFPYMCNYCSYIAYKNEIHMFGGGYSFGHNTNYHFSSSFLMWKKFGDLPYVAYSSHSVIFNGKLHLLGSSKSESGTCHYSYNGKAWTMESILPYKFYCGVAIEFENNLHIIGGDGFSYNHYLYNGTTWSNVGLLPFQCRYSSGVVYHNDLHIFCSFGHYKYNSTTLDWTKISKHSVFEGDCEKVNDTIYVADPISNNVHFDVNGSFYSYNNENYIDLGTMEESASVYFKLIYWKNNLHRFSYSNYSVFDGQDWITNLDVTRRTSLNPPYIVYNNKISKFDDTSWEIYNPHIYDYKEFILPKKGLTVYCRYGIACSEGFMENEHKFNLCERIYTRSFTTTSDNEVFSLILTNDKYEYLGSYISIYNGEQLVYAKPAYELSSDGITYIPKYYLISGTVVNNIEINETGLTEIELPAVITYKKIPEHDHTFIESGANHVCNICGLTEEHTFSEDFTVDTEPTCSNTGSKSNHCTKCTAKTNVTEIPVVPHNYISAITKEAACEEEGITTFTCSLCGNSYEETIPALGHDYSTEFTVDVPPTCNSVGSKSKHCSRCDAKTEVTEIPITEHNYVGTVTKQATCTETGLKTFTCSMCDDTYEEVIPALGHNYVNGTCSNCGDTKIIAPASETANWVYTLDEENKKIILNQYIGNATEVTVYEAYNADGDIYNTALVSNSGTTGLSIFAGLSIFVGNKNVTSIKFNSGIDTNDLKNLKRMFFGCSSLTNIDFSYFDTSNVTDMAHMFSGCSNLQTLDLSSFNTSNVTDMGCMFAECSSLTTLDVSSFDTSKVYRMGSMFQGCSSLTNLDLSNFKVDSIGSPQIEASDFNSMFHSCTNLVSLNLSGFGSTKGLCFCGYMFKNCKKLSMLIMPNFAPIVSELTDTFYGCSSLKSLDLSKWDVSNVTIMNELFSPCTALENLNVSTWDTSNVTNMNNMFAGLKIKTLDLGTFNTSNVTSMKTMFYNCSSLTNLDLRSFDTKNATNMTSMFYLCLNLSIVYVTKSKWITSQADTDGMFLRCGCSSVTYA